MILKGEKIKLLEEEVFQVPKKVARILSFQEICGLAGILGIRVRSDEAMNEKPEEGTRIIAGDQWRRNLYVSEMYMGKYWHMDYDVLMQEHIQL